MADTKQYTPGARVRLGRGKIVWRVLHTDEATQTMLLLADEPIAGGAYHTERAPVTWRDCGLRRWLNEVYLPHDGSLACAVKTVHDDSTEDTLFLLSAEDVRIFLPVEADRVTENGIWWRLRSPGCDSAHTAIVDSAGYIYENGAAADMIGGIRPAVRVPLHLTGLQVIESR